MPNDKPRILIVEDDAVLRRGLARVFSGDQFEVKQISDGPQATDSISSWAPDLILCDYRLPGLDGLGVLEYLKQSGRETPFILMTAYYSEELAARAMERGATVVFEKPFTLNLLRSQCDQALRLFKQP